MTKLNKYGIQVVIAESEALKGVLCPAKGGSDRCQVYNIDTGKKNHRRPMWKNECHKEARNAGRRKQDDEQ